MSTTLRRLLTPQKLFLLVSAVLLLFLPAYLPYLPVVGDDFLLFLGVMTLALVYVMFASSWDILSGYTGQVNFGHAGFIGAGGFTVGLLSKYREEVPAEAALLAAMLVAAIIGLIIGVPCLRLHGPYLALATLTAASALFQLSFIFKEQTGGEEGISGIDSVVEAPVLGPLGEGLATVLTFGAFNGQKKFNQEYYVEYYVTLLFMMLVLGGLLALGYGKRGLVLRSIQQQESAAEAAGVPVTAYKLAAFVLSGTLAGLAGGLLVLNRGSVGITELLVSLSLAIIIISAIGGAGSIIGPAIGALVVIQLQFYWLDKVPGGFTKEHPELKFGLFALLLIVMLIVQPRGLVPPLLQKLRDRQNRALLEGSRG